MSLSGAAASDFDKQRDFGLAELLSRTGVGKETVHFYLREGLLPTPHRLGPRRSLYNENHVELIGMIRRLQRDPGLPLSTIAKMVAGAGWSAEALGARIGSLLDDASVSSQAGDLGSAERIRRGGETLALLEAAGVLAPEPGLPGEGALQLADWVRAAESAGFESDELIQIMRLTGAIVEIETDTLERLGSKTIDLGGQASVRSRAIGELIRAGRAEQLRRAGISVLASSPDVVSQLAGSLYRPSEEFIKGHRTARFLDLVERQVLAGSLTDEAAEQAATLAVVLGDTNRAGRMVKAMSRPNDPAFLDIELAFIRGRVGKARSLAEVAVEKHPDSASFWAIAGLTRLAEAIAGADSEDSGLESARQALRAAEALAPIDLFDSLRVDFQLGRLYTIIPFDTRAHERAILHLTSALRRLERSPGLDAFPGLVPAFNLQLLFLLGEARSRARDRQGARDAWSSVIEIDGESNLGKIAGARIRQMEEEGE